MHKIEIEVNGENEEMTVTEFARWGALSEALGFIQEMAENKGVDSAKCLKPLAIDKYIEERYPSILHDVKVEALLGNI